MLNDGGDALTGFLAGHGDIGQDPALKPGSLAGKWKIDGFIGRGGSAEVYAAHDVDDGTPAAIKVLYRTEERLRERFALESSILVRSRVPYTPRIYGTGEVDGRPFMALELLEPLPPPRRDRAVAKYLSDIAGALKWLHDYGYVHRDVKPRNVMRRGDGTSVLIDYGLVKDYSPLPVKRSDQLSIVDGKSIGVGTPGYAAPEQFAGGDATPATDIHALGILADECLGGHPSPAWSKIIRRATSSIPRERFQTVDDFMRAVGRRHAVGRHVAIFAASAGVVLSVAMFFAGEKPREIPEVFELRGQEVTIAEPIVLRPGRTYKLIGPGILDADISSRGEAKLWMTNCVLNNRSTVVYPKNRVKYELSSEVYLNFANQENLATNVGVFVVTPDGVREDVGRLLSNSNRNDIRFGGPLSKSSLSGRKNIEYFNEKERPPRLP